MSSASHDEHRAPPLGARLARLLRREHAVTVLPIVAAAIVALATGATATTPLATQRGLAFVLGPLLLLVTLHARTAGYLHDDAVSLTLPLPIDGRDRFAAAHRRHLAGWAWQCAWGLAAIVGAALPGGLHSALAIGLDVAALMLAALAIEPLGAAIAARLGQRVPPESPAAQLQRSLGGGWTLPEAVVHLYAPAFALATAAALAMPWQLAIDRALDGLAVSPNHLIVCATTAALALVLRLAAPRLYTGGVYDAVPWLREAMRTLAGPSAPEPAPGWLTWLRDPALRLVVLQHQRLTPVPMLRLVLLLGAATVMAARGRPLGPIELGLLLALAALWLVPATAVLREAQARRRILAALPVTLADRRAAALLLAPLALVAVLLWITTGGLA